MSEGDQISQDSEIKIYKDGIEKDANISDLTKLFEQFKLDDSSSLNFVGFAEQRATLREIIELKT